MDNDLKILCKLEPMRYGSYVYVSPDKGFLVGNRNVGGFCSILINCVRQWSIMNLVKMPGDSSDLLN